MKFAHFRPLVVVFLSFMAGIVLANFVRNIGWWFVLVIIAVGALLIGACFVKYENTSFRAFARGNAKALITVFAVILICQPIFFITQNSLKPSFSPVEDRIYQISGVADQSVRHYDSALTFYLRDLVVTYNFEDTATEENMYVVVFLNNVTSSDSILSLVSGQRITFNAKITLQPTFEEDGSINSYSYAGGAAYAAKVHYTDVLIGETERNFTENITAYVGTILKQGMGEKFGGLALAVLLGDRSNVDRDLAENFRITGVTHLISISGMHVGFFVILLMFVLRRTNLSIRWRTVITAGFLLFYCFLCGFSAPVVRSGLMAVFILLGTCFGKQYDPLCSVSLAGIVILLFKPLYVFDVGFLLSFASVFAIFALMPIFMKWMKRWPKVISGTAAVSLAATIGTAPLIMVFFGTFPIYTLFANLIIVPLFGLVYILMFAGVLVCLLTVWFAPFMAYILKPAEWGFLLIDEITAFMARLPFAVLVVPFQMGFGVLCYYAGIFTASRFCLIPKRIKALLTSMLLGIFAVEVLVYQVLFGGTAGE